MSFFDSLLDKIDNRNISETRIAAFQTWMESCTAPPSSLLQACIDSTVKGDLWQLQRHKLQVCSFLAAPQACRMGAWGKEHASGTLHSTSHLLIESHPVPPSTQGLPEHAADELLAQLLAKARLTRSSQLELFRHSVTRVHVSGAPGHGPASTARMVDGEFMAYISEFR